MSRTSVIKFHAIVKFLGSEAENLLKRGEQHVEARHVLSYTYDKEAGRCGGTVTRSQKKTSVEVSVDFKGNELTEGRCQCQRGLTRCSHMAALLIFLHNNLSVTDILCAWNSKKETAEDEGKPIDVLYPRTVFEPYSAPLPDEVWGRVLADLDKCGGGGAGLRWLLSPEPERDDVAPPSADASIFPLVDNILKSSDYQSAESKRTYLEEALRMDSHLIEFLAEATISQSSNPLWAAIRKFRLTATMFGSILRSLKNNRKVATSTLKALLHPACLDKVHSVTWGRDHEDAAIAKFTEKTGKTVSPTGIWLHTSGAIGGSPDGLVDGETALIECKCPFKFRDCTSLKEALTISVKTCKSDLYVVNYLNNKWVTNTEHDYYHQMQGCMHFSNRNLCYLVVWTPKDSEVFPIPKDPEWSSNIDMLLDFYFSTLVPYFTKNM